MEQPTWGERLVKCFTESHSEDLGCGSDICWHFSLLTTVGQNSLSTVFSWWLQCRKACVWHRRWKKVEKSQRYFRHNSRGHHSHRLQDKWHPLELCRAQSLQLLKMRLGSIPHFHVFIYEQQILIRWKRKAVDKESIDERKDQIV